MIIDAYDDAYDDDDYDCDRRQKPVNGDILDQWCKQAMDNYGVIIIIMNDVMHACTYITCIIIMIDDMIMMVNKLMNDPAKMMVIRCILQIVIDICLTCDYCVLLFILGGVTCDDDDNGGGSLID